MSCKATVSQVITNCKNEKVLTGQVLSASGYHMAKEIRFGDKLREWRKKHGWYTKEAAAFLNVPLDTYRQWECNMSQPHESPSRREIEQRMEGAK